MFFNQYSALLFISLFFLGYTLLTMTLRFFTLNYQFEKKKKDNITNYILMKQCFVLQSIIICEFNKKIVFKFLMKISSFFILENKTASSSKFIFCKIKLKNNKKILNIWIQGKQYRGDKNFISRWSRCQVWFLGSKIIINLGHSTSITQYYQTFFIYF